jgi:adenine-specific DNA-methyltransferase
LLDLFDKTRVEVAACLDAKKRSALGQFMTPATVARFMASLFPASQLDHCRLLDPGAGIGSLTCAFLERWKEGGFGFRGLSAVAYEVDETLRAHLEKNLLRYAADLPLSLCIRGSDFIEAAVASLTGDMFEETFPPCTHAILNPPYKKIGTQSRHRQLLRQAGIETVNLYSGFVALALAMLEPGGQLVAIIPRSFCNGPYYRPFRDFVLRRAAIKRIHLFESRNKAFKDDRVLQENVIIHLERGGSRDNVAISTSTDDLFDDCAIHVYPFEQIVSPADPEQFIHIPTSPEPNPAEVSDAFKYQLSDLGIEVSTGPVVDFRLRKHLRDTPEHGAVPLLYPCHFSKMTVEWPKLDARKPNAIVRNRQTERWLYPNGCYAVVRRFSSKEERRRLVASVVSSSSLDASVLGFENHLSTFFISRRMGLMKIWHGVLLFS